ncbi:MAG: GNAT family N-acetyltransferase [Bacteroidales bacterium]|nr:GNAT family N-acetyltransferase [Bacteroidales bacterium]
MSKKYTFREITEKDELEKSFRLRYNVYSKCRMNSFVKPNKHSIDIDSFDLHSRHFTLICNNTIVGYMRVVLPKEEILQQNILELGNMYDLLNDSKKPKNDGSPYPFLNYKGTPGSYWNYYHSLSIKNEGLVEASRLALLPEYRTIRSSKFLIECIMVFFILICERMKHAVIACYDNHSAFYKYYGFKEIDSGNKYQFPINFSAFILVISLSSIPDKNHSRFQEMAEEFKTTHKIVKVL